MICPACGSRKKKGVKCKGCDRIKSLKYQRTFRGKLQHKYRSIKSRCKRTGIELGFNSKEFMEWALNSSEYSTLYHGWVSSGYKRWETPSVDRLDDAGGYTPGNVRWTTWRENYRKYCLSHGFDPFAKTEGFTPPPEEEIPDYL